MPASISGPIPARKKPVVVLGREKIEPDAANKTMLARRRVMFRPWPVIEQGGRANGTNSNQGHRISGGTNNKRV